MGLPAAKQGDQIKAVDMHMILIPAVVPVPALIPHPFMGVIDRKVSSNVKIEGMPAATVGSMATNMPHVPSGGSFVRPPMNQATIVTGSVTVFINGKSAARSGDMANTCNDPADLPFGIVMAQGRVMIG